MERQQTPKKTNRDGPAVSHNALWKKIVELGKINEKETVLFRNLAWDSSTRTYKGVVIDPESQDEYDITIQIPAKDRFTFSVKRFFLSRTFQFVRIE